MSGWFSLSSIVDLVKKEADALVQDYKKDFEDLTSSVVADTQAVVTEGSGALLDNFRQVFPGDGTGPLLPTSIPSLPVPQISTAQLTSITSLSGDASIVVSGLWKGVTSTVSGLGSTVSSTVHGIVDGATSALEKASAVAQDALSQSPSHSSKEPRVFFDRKEAMIASLKSDPATYSSDPEDFADFNAFCRAFPISEKSPEIASILREYESCRKLQEKLVPSTVSYDRFWHRYYYRLDKLEKDIERRHKLVTESRNDEEDFDWGMDDADESDPAGPSKQKTNEVTEKPQEATPSANMIISSNVESHDAKSPKPDENISTNDASAVDSRSENTANAASPSTLAPVNNLVGSIASNIAAAAVNIVQEVSLTPVEAGKDDENEEIVWGNDDSDDVVEEQTTLEDIMRIIDENPPILGELGAPSTRGILESVEAPTSEKVESPKDQTSQTTSPPEFLSTHSSPATFKMESERPTSVASTTEGSTTGFVVVSQALEVENSQVDGWEDWD